MGVQLLGMVFRLPMEEPTRKLVVSALANRADDDSWHCFPSLRDLQRVTGLARRTVNTWTARLEADGWLQRIARQRSKVKGQTSNLYRLDMERIFTDCGDVELAAWARVNRPHADDAPAPVQEVHGGDAADARDGVQEVHGGDAAGARAPCTPRTPGVQEVHGHKQDSSSEAVSEAVQGSSQQEGGSAPAQGAAAARASPSGEADLFDPHHPNPQRPKGDESPVVACVPVSGPERRPFAVTERQVALWAEQYPAVDIPRLLLRVREWCEAHRRRLVTPGNVLDWISRVFLASEQSKGPRSPYYNGADAQVAQKFTDAPESRTAQAVREYAEAGGHG